MCVCVCATLSPCANVCVYSPACMLYLNTCNAIESLTTENPAHTR